MALSDYQPSRADVVVKGGSFKVRGLSLDDITAVMGDHLNDLNHLINLYHSDIDPKIHLVEGGTFILNLIKDAPTLVSQIIAITSDESKPVDELAAIARKLPLPVQIDALKKIVHLTFEEYGGVKKFAESLQAMAEQVMPAMSQLATDSNTSAPSSESTAS